MLEQKTNELYEPSRELRQKFDVLIAEYGEGLWNYCRYLTGSPWDGEDLYQETMLKAFGGLYQRFHPTNLKAYLYRIATNTWIDYNRRQKRFIGTLIEEHDLSEEWEDNLEIEDALEHLFHLFTPRQTAVFLLMEIFQFKADEVAGIVKTTPGAIYATIRRMKNKLKNKKVVSSTKSLPSENNNLVIQAYLKAFNEGDLNGILALISDQAHYEASLGFLEVTKEEIKNGSMLYGLPPHRAEEFILWGRRIIVIFADSEKGPLVHDIQYQEVENDKIVFHRSYFFRKEFIIAASKELGLVPQLNKQPFLNWEI